VWHLLSPTRERPARGIHIFEDYPRDRQPLFLTTRHPEDTATYRTMLTVAPR